MLNALAALPRDEHFMDIGANIGTWSLAAAHAGRAVVSFEPLEYNTEILAASANGSFGSLNLRLFKAAVGSADQDAMCVREPLGADRNRGNGQLAPLSECAGTKLGYKAAAEIVKVRSIDSLLGDSGVHVCFGVAKIDVEGYEYAALKGARSVFEGRCPPCAIFLEYNQQYHLRAAGNNTALFEYLVKEKGYVCLKYGGSSNISPLMLELDGHQLTKKKWWGDYVCSRSDSRCAPVAAAIK